MTPYGIQAILLAMARARMKWLSRRGNLGELRCVVITTGLAAGTLSMVSTWILTPLPDMQSVGHERRCEKKTPSGYPGYPRPCKTAWTQGGMRSRIPEQTDAAIGTVPQRTQILVTGTASWRPNACALIVGKQYKQSLRVGRASAHRLLNARLRTISSAAFCSA